MIDKLSTDTKNIDYKSLNYLEKKFIYVLNNFDIRFN